MLKPVSVAKASASRRCCLSCDSSACIGTRRPLAVLLRLTASRGRNGSHSSCATTPISSWLSCSRMHEDEAAAGWGGGGS
eukprot:scaffold4478_cov65-Phaeocystis_antarctica.AAC.5